MIIIISFIFVQFAFGYLLGVNTTIKDDISNSNATDTGLNADAVKTASTIDKSEGKVGFGNFFDINDPLPNW